MSDETHRKYRPDLRGNQDVLLEDIRRSPVIPTGVGLRPRKPQVWNQPN